MIARKDAHRELRKGGIAQLVVEKIAEPRHDAGAAEFEQAIKHKKDGHQNPERHQSRHAPAYQHPVIDLQHEKRSGQQQKVGYHAETGNPKQA
jgi:hypothetical protein